MTTLDHNIDTERLVLRPFEKADLEDVAAYHGLPEVQRYLEWKARDKGEMRAALDAMRKQTRLNRPGDVLTLAVTRKNDDAVIGHVSLRWTDATAGQGEIRFVFSPIYRRQGYATEAVRAMIGVGFNRFNFHRIFARCAGSNQASARLLKGLGMRLEAHFREHALFQGEWDEELHFAVLDREWQRSGKVEEITRHKVA